MTGGSGCLHRLRFSTWPNSRECGSVRGVGNQRSRPDNVVSADAELLVPLVDGA